MKRILYFSILLLAAIGCGKTGEPQEESAHSEQIQAFLRVKPFREGQATKTAPELASYTFLPGDRIGIVPYDQTGSGSERTSQMALSLSGTDGPNTATFSTGIGWTLLTNGRYKYVAYYPYSADYASAGLPLDFTTQVQDGNDDASHTAQYDVLYSDPLLPILSQSASFSMNHLCALAKVIVTVPEEYASASFKRLSIKADDNVFVRSGSCDVGATVDSGIPTFTPSNHTNLLGLGLENVTPSARKVTCYMMMYPAALEGETLTVRLWVDQTNRCLSGTLSGLANQENGYAYTYEVNVEPSASPSYLPDKPEDGEKLNILLVSHSFGVDATEYLPALMVEAGIDNVNLGRFYYPNCSLERHWDYYVNDTKYSYYYCAAGATKFGATSKTLKSVLQQTPWDIVVFQQSIAEDAGNYATYQPYLNNLIQAVNEECLVAHDKLPYIGWHMFWGYGGSYTTMWNNIKTATQAMMADTGIQLLIPSGTAVDIARGQTYVDAESATKGFIDEIYGDGFHCSRGVGRYLGSCTWFESVIKPIYGVSVVGNTFRMLDKMSGESDAPEGRKFFAVDDIKAPLLQSFAATAAASPFGE